MKYGVVLVLGIVFTACCPKQDAPHPAAGCPKGSPPTDRTQLEACLNSIEFDGDYAVSDSQPLTVIESGPAKAGQSLSCPGDAAGAARHCRYGPIGVIEPAIGAQSYSEDDLREGRVIARLSIPGTEKSGYAKYGLKPGLRTYWWVLTDSTGRGGKSVFLTVDQSGQVGALTRPLKREWYDDKKRGTQGGYKSRKWWRAAARWIWSLDDEVAKGKCGAGSCS